VEDVEDTPEIASLSGRYIVEREDGQHRPDARYFVLNYASDPYARAALLAYAEACAATHPTLATDIREVVAYHEQRDAARRRDPSKPVRGTQGSGASPADSEAIIDILRRRLAEDDELARALRALLRENKSAK
jgi:hypothetical protein